MLTVHQMELLPNGLPEFGRNDYTSGELMLVSEFWKIIFG